MGRKVKKIEPPHNIVTGYHPVIAILHRAPECIKELWISYKGSLGRKDEILRLASDKGVRVRFNDKELLDEIAPDMNHQGIVGFIEEFKYTSVDELATIAVSKGEQGLLIVADHITDEGNLGAMLRTACFFGVDGLILPKDRSAGITGNVIRRSSGAWIYIPVARVVNLGRTLDYLNEIGLWIIGTDDDASVSIYEMDWRRPLVVILGSEQKGMSFSVRKRCHEIVKIPSRGYPDSLNVSVATGVVLSEITRQRGTSSD